MKRIKIILLIIGLFGNYLKSQTNIYELPAFGGDTVSLVDFDAFEQLTSEVKEYRKDRLVSLVQFLEMSLDSNTIILDTRSEEMYNAKHLKGAIHLNFSDFSMWSLAQITGSNTNKRIIIYCNNNFKNDPIYFFTKAGPPRDLITSGHKPLTLALNIPTFINLYGYGYKNIYELGELISVNDPRIQFEGTSVKTITN